MGTVEYWAVQIYGISFDDLSLKDEFQQQVVWYDGNEEWQEAHPDEESYETPEDVLKENTDLDWERTGYDDGDTHIFGVVPKYSWDEDAHPFANEEDAKSWIVEQIAPFVTQTKERLRELCRYFDIAGCE